MTKRIGEEPKLLPGEYRHALEATEKLGASLRRHLARTCRDESAAQQKQHCAVVAASELFLAGKRPFYALFLTHCDVAVVKQPLAGGRHRGRSAEAPPHGVVSRGDAFHRLVKLRAYAL